MPGLYCSYPVGYENEDAMCGRYGFSAKDAAAVAARFAIANTLSDYTPRYNISPGQMNPVVIKQSPNQLVRMFWGLIPHFAKDDSFKYKTINARAETVKDLPTFRKPFRQQRCLVPATFFYEPDKSHTPSIPYLFRLQEEELFAMAGLYDVWQDPTTGKELYSYTIITTAANALVGKVHPRMPVILHKDDEETWLNPDITEPKHLQPLLVPYPADQMTAYRVGQAVWNPRIDTPALIQPVQQEKA